MAGYIDTWGRGTLKIINACKEAGLPEPEIKEMNGGIEVTIYSHIINDETGSAIGGQVGGQVGAQVGGQVGGQDDRTIEVLTERQKEVYKLMVDNPKISRKQLANKLKINESAVQKHTDALKKKGLIERESETTGQWTIIVKK